MPEIYVTKVESATEYGNPVLRIHGRDAIGEQRTIVAEGLLPFFYATSGHGVLPTDHEAIVSIEAGFTSLFGQAVDKVTVASQWDVRKVRDLFPHGAKWESDVWYTDRARILYGIKSGVKAPSERCHVDDLEPVELSRPYRVMTLDIETDDRGAFPKPGEKRILSIVTHDSYTGETVGFFDLDGKDENELFPNGVEGLDHIFAEANEVSMLRQFTDYLEFVDPDVLTAWNVDFDIPFIVKRCENIGIDAARLSRDGSAKLNKKGKAIVKGRNVFDLLRGYKRLTRGEKSSYKLGNVGLDELGEDKIDHTGTGFYELYQQDPEKFLRYNAKDVALAVAIDEKVNIIRSIQARSDTVGTELENSVDPHGLIEMFARRKLHEKGLVGPDARHEKKDEKYEGALVFKPFRGMTTNVTGVDLASLYPMTMKMFNISPEVKVEASEPVLGQVAYAPNGVGFSLDKRGIFAELVDDAVSLKKASKKAKLEADPDSDEYEALSIKYDADKAVTNSLYGVLGWEHFFLYDEDCALAITLGGQECIKATQAHFSEATEGVVIYGDTDSNYVEWPEAWDKVKVLRAAEWACNQLNNEVYPSLAEKFGIPAKRNEWKIELESYAKTYFQHGKKKRYAMWITWQDGKDVDKKKVTGYKRSDVSKLTAELIDDVLEEIVHGADRGAIGGLVMNAAKEIEPSPDDLTRFGVPGGIGQPLEDYVWTNGSPQDAQPRAAHFSNLLFGKNYGSGSKPMRLYIPPRKTPFGEVDVIAFEENSDVPDDYRQLDVQRMTDTLITNPLGDILDAAGIDISAAMTGQMQTGLDSFA